MQFDPVTSFVRLKMEEESKKKEYCADIMNTLQQQIETATRQVKEYKAKLEQLTTVNKTLIPLTQENTKLKKEIERLNKENATLTGENKKLSEKITALTTEIDNLKSGVGICVPKFNTQDPKKCEENSRPSRQVILDYDALILEIGKQISDSFMQNKMDDNATRSDNIAEFRGMIGFFKENYTNLKKDMEKVAKSIFTPQTPYNNSQDILTKLNESKKHLATMADANEADTLSQMVGKLRKKLGDSLCVDAGNDLNLDKNIKNRLQQLSALCTKTGNDISGAIDTCEKFANETSKTLTNQT